MPDIDPDVNQQGLLATSPLAPQALPQAVTTPAQSFDSPEYQKSVYEWEQDVRRKAEAARAEQAIQSGIRYIYQRRYDDDLKNGIPESQAFSRMMLGIALHTPKSDPTKMFDAFRNRPSPQPQMMQFGTNQVPVIVNTDKGGAQRATVVPSSALPQTPGEVIKRYDPDLKRWLIFRNGQWYTATAEETARLTPLEKAVETGARKSMNAAQEELANQAKRTAPNTNKVAQATQQFQNASNTLQQLSAPRTSATSKAPEAPRDPKQRESNKVYVTPRGKLRWTGTGWIQP